MIYLWSLISTCVSVRCNCLARAVRLATDKYFPRSNSPSSAFIWEAENAVRGLFLRSSPACPESVQLGTGTLNTEANTTDRFLITF